MAAASFVSEPIQLRHDVLDLPAFTLIDRYKERRWQILYGITPMQAVAGALAIYSLTHEFRNLPTSLK